MISEHNHEIKEQILNTIRANSRIILTRHKRPDGDAVGSTLGLAGILRATFPEKEIFVINEDFTEATAFLGKEDKPISDEDYADALILALDTGTADRLSNTKTDLAKAIVKIDHHIDDTPYGDLCWIEPERSSTCEMIVDFYKTFESELTMTKEAATCLYCGIVTDSGRFRYRETSAETFAAAGLLLSFGIDTDTLFANLYIDDPKVLTLKAYVLRNMKFTKNGVAYLILPKKAQKRLGITQEEASGTIGTLDGIRGSMIWLVMIENDDGKSYRVRLRSRFVEIQPLAVRYHGGGHACASGAKTFSRAERKRLLADADALLKQFKNKHTECF